MCGISGLISEQGSRESLIEGLQKMTSALKNRGPDDEGTWADTDAGVFLGHRRLSILDLSPEGHQPMLSASGRFAIVFNGEVYNYLGIQKELIDRGHKFRGHSDTEVMLAAFEEWGVEASVPRFNGMFAFGVWDKKERCLYLVRDRLGIKPLYYGWNANSFLFASELKSLEAFPQFNASVDRDSICLYLRHNSIPAPHTAYHGVFKLWQGSLLRLSYEELLHKPSSFSAFFWDEQAARRPLQYWSARKVMEEGERSPYNGSDAQAIDELHTLTRDCVGLRMISDVPLGAFLSGGIDSSTVVALMQAQSSTPVKTFSIGFHEKEYNEASYANEVAKHLGTDHTELYVTPQEALDVIPQLPHLYDEPFADSSQIPTYLLAALTRKKVTVSLSGDGGDELFGGYTRYLSANKILGTLTFVPQVLRSLGASALEAIPADSWDMVLQSIFKIMPQRLRFSHAGEKMHKLAKVLRVNSAADAYHQMISHWSDPAALVLGGKESRTISNQEACIPDLKEAIHQMMYLDLMNYLADEVMVKVDRATMSASLEAREPLLDYRLFEFAARLPLHLKIREGQGKWILRQVLYRYVPKHLVERPKMGFGVPIGAWLRGPLKSWAEDLLSERRLKADGILDPKPIRQKWIEHLEGKHNWQYHLWDVLMLQAWLSRPRRI